MGPFADYLRLCGLTDARIAALAPKLTGWEELWAWMDGHQAPLIQPAPRRIPVSSPELDRSWKRNLWRRFVSESRGGAPVGVAPGWERLVAHRQRVTLVLTTLATLGVLRMSYLTLKAQQMPQAGMVLYLVVNGLMVFFLASNFFKLLLGAWHALRGADANPWHPIHTARDPRPTARVAIVFPIYHEDAARVAAGVAATWSSLAQHHPELSAAFDVYILSDSRKIEYWIAEQAAVYRLSEAFPDGRFFYRRRPMNKNAKLGNITDFCRRWGEAYAYMLVMDADSVMDGDAMTGLLRMMEGNHRIGILQTNPAPILRKSLFGRMQQFAARLYGSVFSYSLQAMYMGHASYIGHNAMIRLKPFMAHCILPDLPGKAPWGGKPLSHDIVESAMMARAGYEVWFLPEVTGSYEEVPSNLVDFLIRERRWMQGNLQHFHFLFVNGLRGVHRETFITGSMGYVAAPLWATFLVVSVYGMFHFLNTAIPAVDSIGALAVPAATLIASSMIFLFMPRLLALAIHIPSHKARLFGGKDKLVWSILFETAFSFLFSPILMICLSRFIWLWLRRKSISWDAQVRGDQPLRWEVCLRYFGWVSALGSLASFGVFHGVSTVPDQRAALLQAFSGGWMRPNDMFLWLLPILGGLAFSAIIARATSFSFAGIASRRLFTIPEEVAPSATVRAVGRWEGRFQAWLADLDAPDGAIAHATQDRAFFVRHRRETRYRPRIAAALLPHIRSGAPLSPRQAFLALTERRCFDELHRRNAPPLAEAQWAAQ